MEYHYYLWKNNNNKYYKEISLDFLRCSIGINFLMHLTWKMRHF